jgi:hypothetical protein
MHKIWFGLAFVAIIAEPAMAQDYHKNFVECTKELGLRPDAGYTQKIQSEGGRTLRRWYFQSEAQAAVFNDCVARKASLAPKPSAKGRASR